MTRRLALPLALVLVVGLAACAHPSAATSTVGHAPASAAAPPVRQSSSCGAHVVASDDANGQTVCVQRGSDLTVLLHGPGWSAPQATGTALKPAGPVPTPAGAVGWSFQAVAAGSADITTSRPICPSVASGAIRCHSVAGYRLHVEVE